MRKNLTRIELTDVATRFLGGSRREAAGLVDAVFDEISDSIARGEDVKLSGFGVFSVRAKAERMGRNPRNGEPARITPRRVVAFRASRLMKARLSGAPAADDAED